MSPKGTLLALCEAREGDDGDPTDLVLKRSLYDGRPSQPRQLNGYPRTFGYGINWLPMQVVLLNPLHPRLRPPHEPTPGFQIFLPIHVSIIVSRDFGRCVDSLGASQGTRTDYRLGSYRNGRRKMPPK